MCTATAKSKFLQVGGRILAIIAVTAVGGSKGGAAPCQTFPLTAMSPSDRAKMSHGSKVSKKKKGKEAPAWCSDGCFNWLNKIIWEQYVGHEGGKRWDRRSFPPTLLCDIHQLPACAAVNIEIYYTRAFHHLLHVQGCTVLLNKKKKRERQRKKKKMFLLLCGMCVWGMQQHTLIHVDHKTLRCYWRLVNHNKWCNGIKRLGCVNGFSTHMAADRVRIIQFWCQQRETLLYHIFIVAEF